MAQLPIWRRENHIYPVLTWPLFAEAIRSKVNPLASDDHIKLLVEQLQLMGEVGRNVACCRGRDDAHVLLHCAGLIEIKEKHF